MRKTFFPVFALTLLMSSCDFDFLDLLNQDLTQDPDGGVIIGDVESFRASQYITPATRVTGEDKGDDGLTFAWELNDVVSLYKITTSADESIYSEANIKVAEYQVTAIEDEMAVFELTKAEKGQTLDVTDKTTQYAVAYTMRDKANLAARFQDSRSPIYYEGKLDYLADSIKIISNPFTFNDSTFHFNHEMAYQQFILERPSTVKGYTADQLTKLYQSEEPVYIGIGNPEEETNSSHYIQAKWSDFKEINSKQILDCYIPLPADSYSSLHLQFASKDDGSIFTEYFSQVLKPTSPLNLIAGNSYVQSIPVDASKYSKPEIVQSDYYMGIGRIACSSDGNMHDNDDWTATMMTFMILARAGVQDITTVYTHSDHIWGSEGNDLEQMKLSAEGAAKRFGFNACNVIAAVEEPERAYTAMAEQIAKSTAADPLFIIAAGPMHVVGTAFERANKTNPEALNHVTVISHSTWNERHADNYEKANGPHGGESPHEGWTWDEMVKAFGEKVNFNQISDQNGTGTGSEVYKTKDKFSAPNWEKWDWMRTHVDPNVQWVYTRGKEIYNPDYSDAGMAYYLVADLNGERGDQMGNPEKLRQWVGPDAIPVIVDETLVWSITLDASAFTLKNIGDTKQITANILPETAADKTVEWSSSRPEIAIVSETGLVTALANGSTTITAKTVSGGKIAKCSITVGEVEAGDVKVGEDFIVFEAESSKSSLGSNWKIIRQGDPTYDGIAGQLPAFGGAYIEATAGPVNGLNVVAGEDMLQYKFTPKTSGNYKLSGRMAQRLDQPQGTAKWDECNDIFIKMEGDYTSGITSTPITILQTWNKYYGRGHVGGKSGTWGAFVQVDKNHTKYQAVYALKAGQEYTFSISARSRGVCIDYFLLCKSPIIAQEQKDLATHNDAKYRPDSDVFFVNEVYAANTLNILQSSEGTSIAAADFVAAVNDWYNKSWLGIDKRLKWGAAETTYNGESGELNVFINTVLEEDGESTYRVFVDNTLIKEVTNDRIFDTETPNYTLKSHKLTDQKMAIEKGDKIRVEFNSATNGFVPEGNLTATSRGRWASLIITTMDKVSVENPNKDDQPTQQGSAPTLHSHNAPTSVDLSTNSYDFELEYSSETMLDVAITIHNTTDEITSGLGFIRVNNLPKGEHVKKTITLKFDKPLQLGKNYKWSIYFMPPGGTWKNQYAPLNIPFKAVEGNQ